MFAPTDAAPATGSVTTAGFTSAVQAEFGTHVVSSHSATSGIPGSC